MLLAVPKLTLFVGIGIEIILYDGCTSLRAARIPIALFV
jgi:hypothetical protein